uniref:ABC transporter domain-containing protein n=1 Tax=Caenorhabditis japonica TaxID=281687 RepID=A0A8R1HLJ5_CAEJA
MEGKTDIEDTGSIYNKFAPLLYREINKFFLKEAAANNYTPAEDRDELHSYYIEEKSSLEGDSVFSQISFVLGLCMTLPVMNIARSVVGEKATIENFHPVWLLLGVFLYITTCISISMFVSSFFTTPRRGLEGVVLAWIALGLTSFSAQISPKGWWHLTKCLNINHNAKLFFLSMEPHFSQDDGMNFFDGFVESRENLYACYVYLSIMFVETILLARLSTEMDWVAVEFCNWFIKTIWRKTGILRESPKPSEAELEAILLGEEVVEGRLDAASDIELNNLIKIYTNGEMAVSGLSMRAIRGQVSVLLGHNGCGKSTTFGMITGILEPTDGTITIEGVDAVQNRGIARESIGYCPQYNPLYDKLTVMEHLRLVNTLKGGDPNTFEEDAEMLLKQIRLTDKKDVWSKNLSGGMKRKLCVCMAMIGGSRVVLLDEPTAGMDPAARLDVQNMLEKVKRERTILLTTHYMDEAEKLSDWIFVMSHGRIAASGSIHYLKKTFGDGYMMTLVMSKHESMEEAVAVIGEVLSEYVEGAEIVDQRGQIIEISLPEKNKSQFLPLLEAMESIIDKSFDSEKLEKLASETLERLSYLDIVAMGLSMSSLEKVFIKIGNGCDQALYGINDEEKRTIAAANFDKLEAAKAEPRLKGVSLLNLQYRALLFKRLIHVYHNLDQLIFQYMIPFLVYTLIASHTWKVTIDLSTVFRNSYLSSFPSSKVLLQFEGAVDQRVEDYLLKFNHLEVEHVPFNANTTELLTNRTANEKEIGLVIKSYLDHTVIHYYEKSIDCLPIALNLLTNLKYLRISSNYSVGNYDMRMEFAPVEGMNQAYKMLWWALFWLASGGLMMQYAIQPAVLFLIEERVCKFLHQQLLTGISPWVFWSGNILWDFLMFMIVSVYGLTVYTDNGIFIEHFYLVFPTFICFFLAYVAFVYLVSSFLNSPIAGSIFLTVHSTFGILVGFLVFQRGVTHVPKTYAYGFFDMNYIQTLAMTKLYISQLSNRVYFGLFFNDYFRCESIFSLRGIWIDWIYLLLLSVLFFWFFAVFRSRTLAKMRSGFGRATPKAKKRYEFIETLTSDDSFSTLSARSSNDDTIIDVQNLVKDFKKMRAVNGLTLQVMKRECFGLLGQNGAGKTTTFDMLTGLTVPSGGKATIAGAEINNGTEIGYCPQFDAMMEQYTGRDILTIMACLQGYREYDKVVVMVLACIGMTEHAGKQVKHCSGGQKRKLSVGVALLSRSPCVMLDEPTAGIDPRARREIWDILHCLREKAEGSIILTSHSMEECEALCTRIGVVREGELIALGTSQELKSKYGCFYVMTLVLPELEDMGKVKKAVLNKWKGAYLKSEPTLASLNMVYQLPRSSDDKWSEMFMQVEELAAELGVADYMLTQATLEDAFLRLNA